MSTAEHEIIDFVTLDPKRDLAVLVMVEDRPWGMSGMLLPDLQAKMNTYLQYAVKGGLARDYPAVAGKSVELQLRCSYPLGEREEQFVDIVRRQHLDPAGVGFQWVLIGASTQ
jgi:hypothetical protein